MITALLGGAIAVAMWITIGPLVWYYLNKPFKDK